MKNITFKICVLLTFLFANNAHAATDSYRWLHVTIDTPWAIFIFLMPMVLLPAILMAILYWKFSGKKTLSANSVSDKKE